MTTDIEIKTDDLHFMANGIPFKTIKEHIKNNENQLKKGDLQLKTAKAEIIMLSKCVVGTNTRHE